jgi:hypothetical protein
MVTMKKILSIAAVIMCGISLTATARHNCGNDWKEKMQSEKIAFITLELDITPEEAQSFWPVYNMVEKEKDAAFQELITTHQALSTAIEGGNSDEISTALENYLLAQDKIKETDRKAAEEYKAVLPIEKVAKLYVCEEKFRRQHIRKLHKHNKDEDSTAETSGE